MNKLCPSVLSQADYLVMQRLDIASDGAIAKVLNKNGHASWTCCPKCCVDDFTHVEYCILIPPSAARDASRE